jgi:hypothetical protein
MRKQGSEEREFRTVTKREKTKRKKIYLKLFCLPCSTTRENPRQSLVIWKTWRIKISKKKKKDVEILLYFG